MSETRYRKMAPSWKYRRQPDPLMAEISKEDTPWTPIIEWQKNHYHCFPTLAEYNTWWQKALADFEDSPEDFLEYLESLCDSCLMVECKCQPQDPSFSELVNNYEKLLASKKSEFPQ